MERSKIWFLTSSGKCSLWNLNEDTLISRYASSIGGWALGGRGRNGKSPRPKSRRKVVAWRMQRRPLLFDGGGVSMRLKFEARGLELKRAMCFEWAVSSAAVAAWAVRALGFSARASAFFAAAEAASSAPEASSSAMEASSPWATCTKPWRR